MLKKPFLLLHAVLLMGVATTLSPGILAAQVKVIKGVRIPESIAVGPDGRIYVSEVGEYERYGDGAIGVVEGDKVQPFATGLNDPHGIDWWRDHLYVADNRGQVWRIDMKGNVERLVDSTQFPRKITNFNDIEIDEDGNIYLSDSGDWEGRGGAIYRITQDGKITTVLTDEEAWQLLSPNGLLMEGRERMLVLDYTTGNLHRLDLKTKAFQKINGGFGAGDGLARDARGRLYVSDFKGKLYVLDTPEAKPRPIEVQGLVSAADITISPDGQHLLVPDWEGKQLFFVPLPE